MKMFPLPRKKITMKNALSLVFFVVSVLSTNAQTLREQATALECANKIEQALALYQKHALLCRQEGRWQEAAHAQWEATRLRLLHTVEQGEVQALLNEQLAFWDECKKQIASKDTALAWWHLQLGSIYRRLNNNKLSKEYIDSAAKTLNTVVGDTHPRAIEYYSIVSHRAAADRNAQQAAEFSQRALQLGKQNYCADDQRLIILQASAAQYLCFVGENNQAAQLLDQATLLANRVLPKDHVFWTSIYSSRALTFFGDYQQMDKTIFWWEKAAASAERDRNFLLQGTSLLNISTLYKDLRPKFPVEQQASMRELSARYAEKAVAAYERLFTLPRQNIALLYFNQAYLWLYSDKQYRGRALSLFHKGLAALMYEEIPKDSLYYPPVQAPLPYFAEDFLAARLLAGKLEIVEYLYNETKDPKYLSIILELADLIVRCISRNEQEAILPGDKLSSMALLAQNYNNYAKNHWQAYRATGDAAHLDRVFEKMEQGKSVLLSRSLQGEENRRMGGIPEEVAQREAEFKKILDENTRSLNMAIARGDSTSTALLFVKKFNDERAYSDFQKQLRQDYPRYYELSYHPSTATLSEFRRILEPGTVFVNCLVLGYRHLVVVISKDTFYMRPLEYDAEADGEDRRPEAPLKALSELLARGISPGADPQTAYNAYAQAAYACYRGMYLDKIIPPGTQRLLISPSERLSSIPFEVLLVSPPDTTVGAADYKRLDYLLRHHSIQYVYTGGLYLRSVQQPPLPGGRIAAFAAGYDPKASYKHRNPEQAKLRSLLEDLPGAKAEVEQLEALYGGDYFFGKDANETRFKNLNYNQYGILHLAMHGLVNRQSSLSSSLVFSEDQSSQEDNFLYYDELSHLKIPANLVVLSACETGVGQEQSGEGAVSLARSFMYAGVSALVMTLWEVNDQSMALIIQGFYAHMAQGLPKDQALRQAKLDYIDQSKGIAGHPFFWAAPVGLGNPNPIPVGGGGYAWWWIVGGGGIAVAGAALLARRFKRARR